MIEHKVGAKAAAVYCLILLAYLLTNLSPGLRVSDEGVYLLMVDSLADHGSLNIWNGLEVESPQYRFVKTVNLKDESIHPQYPHIYTLFAAPAYLLTGINGLFMLNILSFAASTALAYLIARLFFEDETTAVLSAVVYSAFTYSVRFALDLWPHSLSAYTVLASVYLAFKALKSKDAGFLFYSGLVSGIACGIRYQDVLFTFILAAIIYLEARRREEILFFLSGAAIPFFAIASLNWASYQSLLPAYSMAYKDFADYGYMQVITLSTAAVFTLYTARKRGRDGRFLLLVLVAAVAWMAFDHQFTDKAADSLKVLYSETVDIRAYPFREVVFPKHAKSLLQSAPMLSLSLIGLAFTWKRRRGLFYPLLLLAYVMPVFFSAMPYRYGGETVLRRFYIESLPYMSVLAAYPLAIFFKDFKAGKYEYFTYGCLFIASLFIPFTLASEGALFYSGFYQHIQPVILSVTLAAFYIPAKGKAPFFRQYFMAFLVFTAAYTLVANVTYVSENRDARDYMADVSAGVDLEDDCAVFYSGYMNIDYLAPIKAGKKVRLLNAEVDEAASTVDLIDYYLSSGKPVYLIHYMLENEKVETIGFRNDYWISYVNEDLRKRYLFEDLRSDGIKYYRVYGRV